MRPRSAIHAPLESGAGGILTSSREEPRSSQCCREQARSAQAMVSSWNCDCECPHSPFDLLLLRGRAALAKHRGGEGFATPACGSRVVSSGAADKNEQEGLWPTAPELGFCPAGLCPREVGARDLLRERVPGREASWRLRRSELDACGLQETRSYLLAAFTVSVAGAQSAQHARKL